MSTSNVRNEEVLDISRLAPQLGVKVETTRLKASLLEHHLHGKSGLLEVHVELIRVPSQQWISCVGINAAQKAVRRS